MLLVVKTMLRILFMTVIIKVHHDKLLLYSDITLMFLTLLPIIRHGSQNV